MQRYENFSVRKFDWCNHCKDNLKYVNDNYSDLREIAEYRYYASIIWALNNMTYNIDKFSNYIQQFRQLLRPYLKIKNKLIKSNKKEHVRAIMLVYFYGIYAIIVRLLKKNYT